MNTKLIRSIILTSFISFAALCNVKAAENNLAVNNPPAKSNVQTDKKQEVAAKIDYKDAFLAFALEKAQSYSGAVEGAVSKAVDKATEEAPIVAREFIVWRLWYHGLKAFLPIAFMFIFLGIVYNQWPKYEFNEYQSRLIKGSELNVALAVVGIAGSAISFLIFLVSGLENLFNFIQVLVAPRVYVIEQVLHLMGK